MPQNTSPALCLVLSYSLWSSVQRAGEFRPQECREDFPLAQVETDGGWFFVAARSSSICHPHTLNHRAFARELRRVGCTHVVSASVCKSLDRNAVVPSLVIPDQFIDMHRVVDLPDTCDGIRFVDFSFPFCAGLRSRAYAALGRQQRYAVLAEGCYVGVDGPRSETAAEARAWRLLGGDVVGMTAVREAIAYREAGLCMAAVALVNDYGTGIIQSPVSSGEFGNLLLDGGRDLAAQMSTFRCECQRSL